MGRHSNLKQTVMQIIVMQMNYALVGAKDAALKLGDNMPKNATEMTAKRESNCLECYCIISSGSSIKVYDNKWYHNRCWDKMFNRIIEVRYKKRKINKNFVIYKSSKQSLHNLTNKVIDSLGVISKEIDSIWKEIGKEKTTADEYNE